ncbi:MAG: PaaI family thioesterase [Candidatus Hermodarchaeota archaeon]
MNELNSEHLKIILTLINSSPYFKHLKMEVKEIGIGYSLLEVNLESIHLNPFGSIHGGVYSSIIDTAAYWAVYSGLKEDVGLISMDLNINNLAPTSKGKLNVRGKCIKQGKTVCLAEAFVVNQNGKCLAHGTSKMLVSKNLQTIDLISKFLDTNDSNIPPKFI